MPVITVEGPAISTDLKRTLVARFTETARDAAHFAIDDEDLGDLVPGPGLELGLVKTGLAHRSVPRTGNFARGFPPRPCTDRAVG